MYKKHKIYVYSLCSTCKRSLKWLKENNLEYEMIDICKCTPSKEIIEKTIDQYGDKKYLFNTRGKSYRELGAEKIKSMNNEEAVNALVSDGKLIKRPFLLTSKGKILLGFNEANWSELLLC